MAYNAGYSACANEALRHLGELDNISVTTRQQLAGRLSAHLRRSTVVADDDVTIVTSPTMCDVSGGTRRRLFDSTPRCDEGRRQETSLRRSQRRPLADIQPAVHRRDPPPVCRSAYSNTDNRFPFQFMPDFDSFSGHVVADRFPPALSTQLLSRCVTLTQTMTTTLHQDQQTTTQASASDLESNSRFLSAADGKLEPMWRPW